MSHLPVTNKIQIPSHGILRALCAGSAHFCKLSFSASLPCTLWSGHTKLPSTPNTQALGFPRAGSLLSEGRVSPSFISEVKLSQPVTSKRKVRAEFREGPRIKPQDCLRTDEELSTAVTPLGNVTGQHHPLVFASQLVLKEVNHVLSPKCFLKPKVYCLLLSPGFLLPSSVTALFFYSALSQCASCSAFFLTPCFCLCVCSSPPFLFRYLSSLLQFYIYTLPSSYPCVEQWLKFQAQH